MAKCPSCGANVNDSDRRCSKCGAKIIKENKISSKLIIGGIIGVFLIAVLGVFAIGMISNDSSTQTSDNSNVQTSSPTSNSQPTNNSQQSSEGSSSSGVYWASSKSNKFHNPGCEWAQKISSKNKVVFNSREEAINSGYVPCSVCNP